MKRIQTTTRRPAGRPRRGFVLLIVMIVVVLVSLAGLSFVLTLSTENKAAHLHGDQLQLHEALASGEELIKAVCDQSCAERLDGGGVFENPDLFQGRTLGAAAAEEVRFSVVSPRIAGEQITGVRYGLQDESARLDLGMLARWEQDQPGAAADALRNLPGMTAAMAAAVLDWIDPDDRERSSGAESAYYANRGLPYSPRNGVPSSLEELLLVRDVSRVALYGLDRDANFEVDDRETRAVSGPSGGRIGGGLPWSTLLTVYSAERNTACDGTPRIDLNQVDLQRLQQQLDEVFDPDWTRFIIAYRQFGPYNGPLPPRWRRAIPAPPSWRSRDARGSGRAATAPRVVRADAIPKIDPSLPARFPLQSVFDLVGVNVLIPGDDRRSGKPADDVIVESPFQQDRRSLRRALPELVDRTTAVSEPVIRGRVNVNRAPREVLLGVPGLDRTTVDRILSARAGAGGRDLRVYRTALWLLSDAVVDLDRMRALEPYITGGGDVFRAQVIARQTTTGLTARAELVIDATVTPPRQIYWKDVSLLGQGFRPEVLGAGP